MTQEEWLSHSVDWRQGWLDWQNGNDVWMTAEEKAGKSDEWKSGAMYAAKHPSGQVAVGM